MATLQYRIDVLGLDEIERRIDQIQRRRLPRWAPVAFFLVGTLVGHVMARLLLTF